MKEKWLTKKFPLNATLCLGNMATAPNVLANISQMELSKTNSVR
jgi:NADH:ubiquinone oxidoreductase subunit E